MGLWLIKDTKRDGKSRGWWMPGSKGYTKQIHEAGRFDVVELTDITQRCRRGDFVIEIAPEVNALYPCVECGSEAVQDSYPGRCLHHFRKHHGIGGDSHD